MNALVPLMKHGALPALSAALYYGWIPPLIPFIHGHRPFAAGFVAAFALVVTLPDLVEWVRGKR